MSSNQDAQPLLLQATFREPNGRVTVYTRPADAFEANPDNWDTIRFYWTEGNASCDCNRLDSIADARQEPRPDDPPCGDTIELLELALVPHVPPVETGVK